MYFVYIHRLIVTAAAVAAAALAEAIDALAAAA
jgi:hypothetical protein